MALYFAARGSWLAVCGVWLVAEERWNNYTSLLARSSHILHTRKKPQDIEKQKIQTLVAKQRRGRGGGSPATPKSRDWPERASLRIFLQVPDIMAQQEHRYPSIRTVSL